MIVCLERIDTFLSFPFLFLFITIIKEFPKHLLTSLNPLIKNTAKITYQSPSINLETVILVILQDTPAYLPLRPNNPPQILKPNSLLLLGMGHLDQQYVKILSVCLVDLLAGTIESLVADSVLLVDHGEVG